MIIGTNLIDRIAGQRTLFRRRRIHPRRLMQTKTNLPLRQVTEDGNEILG